MTYFVCNKCDKKYVSTDGARKHARKKHSDWIKSLKPNEYCRPYKANNFNFDFTELIKLLSPLPKIYSMNDNEILTLVTLGHHCLQELSIKDDDLVEEWFSQL